MKTEQKQFNCPVEATLSLIGGKYKFLKSRLKQSTRLLPLEKAFYLC